MARGKRSAQKTKEKLLQTAEKVFVEKGFDGARVDEIASEAKVNKRMIYVFFGSKELLYIEVLKNSFLRLFKSNRPEPKPSGDPLADIEAIVTWYLWFLSENPSFVRLFGWETLNDGRRLGRVLMDTMEEGLGPLQSMVRRGKDIGVFKADLAVHKTVTICTEICLGFFSRIHFFEVLWQRDLSSRKEQQQMLDHILKILRNGICLEKK